MTDKPVDIEGVRRAASRIEGALRPTPLLSVEAISERVGIPTWLKAECFQPIGAFKARGALNAIARLVERAAAGEIETPHEIVTYSSGNHAQAVAWAARRMGIAARVFMPVDAPAIKVEGVLRLGAEVERAGTTSGERQAAAERHVETRGGTIVPPFDHEDIIAGAGTASLEAYAQASAAGAPFDVLFVPVGGGGLIGGACAALSDADGAPDPDVAIIAVEPVGCDSMGQSLAAGEPVAVGPGPTLADGLKPQRVGAKNFAMARGRVTAATTVDDDAIGEALSFLHARGHVVVEPSGAAALAVALRGVDNTAALIGREPRCAAVMLSGGNVDPALVARIITST